MVHGRLYYKAVKQHFSAVLLDGEGSAPFSLVPAVWQRLVLSLHILAVINSPGFSWRVKLAF